ncbi:Tyrosine-protein kinase Src42A [Schistosoma japonicum]|uniref:Tyrosine-protein kinase n=1 Tax=Schistosoma japonicum TaxID=6182 RepID=A0A2S1REI0_SCHJA|nr:tyrosine kinase 3 [Schistosoma japonicum]KAH8868608.1 Tyrosine-protein kinase Src42A [Schistosoma japonicum]QDL52666.1 tyrosine kinase 3 [Schistosoma japonicum]TNN13149.1 Tyrosine-protein kinase Src42A [Schistosoma japonicum]
MGNSSSSNNDQSSWIAVAPNDASASMLEPPLRSVVERRPIFPSKNSFNNGQGSSPMLPPSIASDSSQSFDQIRYQPYNPNYLPDMIQQSKGSKRICDFSVVPVTASDKTPAGNPSCLSSTHQSANFSTIQQPANFQDNSAAHTRNNASHTSSQLPTEGQFVALHDYVKRVDDDLNMTKGQIFNILDNSHCDWWYAECVSTGNRGYVPKNHLAAVTSLESNEWYFGELKRIEAEHYLQLPGNDHGSFLVRISESQSSEYSLSVREENTVKHYRIRSRYSRTDPTLKRFYISRQLPFVNIQQLVNHYLENQSGLCCRLGKPCIRPTHPEPVGLSHKLIDKWEIPKSSIILKEKIGQGQFGEVFKAVWNKTTIVAVKTLKPSSCDAADFLREAQTMKRLHHPNLIQLYAVCTQTEPFYIVTEYMSKGSLLNYLQSPEGHVLDMQCLIMMAAKIASGMAYLESRRHIHRDLAARNVLVGEQHVVKIADFGLARMIHNREYVAHAGARFPIKWTSPEAANYSRFTIKSDVWSFGILLTEIVTYGRSPYPGMHNAEVLRQVDAGYRMSKPPGCPPELYDLMLECWAADENKRPSFATIHFRLEQFCEDEQPAYKNANANIHSHPNGNSMVVLQNKQNVSSGTYHNHIEISVSP